MCNCFFCNFLNNNFLDYKSRTHKFSVLLEMIWFSIPRFIRQQNWKNIKYRCVVDEYGNSKLSEPNPFLGFVLIVEEGVEINWQWWKHLKRSPNN